MLMDSRFVEDGDLFGAIVSRIRISIEVNKFVYKFLRVSVSEYLWVISMLWANVKMCTYYFRPVNIWINQNWNTMLIIII